MESSATNLIEIEEWKAIAGYDGAYEVSTLGRLRSYRVRGHAKLRTETPRIMNFKNRGPYVNSGFSKRIHRLVLETFRGPCPEGCESAHLNGKGWDNRLSNLAWKTPQENHADKRIHGTLLCRAKHSMARLSEKNVAEIRALLNIGVSQGKIASRFGVRQQQISRIGRNKRWREEKSMNVDENKVQQGDVTCRKLDRMPQGGQRIVSKARCVLAHGESGHSHVVEQDDAELIQIGERMLLKISKIATVTHEEHKPVTLAPGIWEIGGVNEFDYFAMMKRRVVD